MWLWDRCSTLWLLFFSPTQLTANNFTCWRSSRSGVVSLSETVTLCCGLLATLLHAFEQISFLVGFADSSQNSTSLSHWRRKWLKSRGRPFQLFSPSKYDKSKKEHLQLLSRISYLHLLLTRCWGYFTCQEDAAHNKSIRMCWVFSPPVSQSHGHSHYPGADHYSTPDRDLEEGEKEKLQQNGEASSLALGKVDAGEGELMLSPAQTPQVWM